MDDVQPGVRVHDGPRAGEVMDHVHERLATLEQTDSRQIAKDRLRTSWGGRDAARLHTA